MMLSSSQTIGLHQEDAIQKFIHSVQRHGCHAYLRSIPSAKPAATACFLGGMTAPFASSMLKIDRLDGDGLDWLYRLMQGGDGLATFTINDTPCLPQTHPFASCQRHPVFFPSFSMSHLHAIMAS
ncbi:hypothetical protein NXS19_006507 [Fusarium pseudograminearum]|nr:hypothetical protein NXS19_006507 [Fusarium pseudograminearum]